MREDRIRCEGIDASGSARTWRARSRCLRAAASLSLSLSLGLVDEYHGLRSCLVGASGRPRSVSVSAGFDFEARAASAEACSSRSAKRLMWPLDDSGIEEDPDPDATGGAGSSASLSAGGGECGGVIPARERSAPRRDSASATSTRSASSVSLSLAAASSRRTRSMLSSRYG